MREYVDSLLDFGLRPEELGVVTPYVQQVLKLRTALPPDVTVGTVSPQSL